MTFFFKLKTDKILFPEEVEQDRRNGTPVVDVSQYESIRRQSENQYRLLDNEIFVVMIIFL